MNYLGFCLGKFLSLIHIWRTVSPGTISEKAFISLISSWRTVLLGIIFLVGSFFQHFENITRLPFGLHNFCWEICSQSWLKGVPICDKYLSLPSFKFSLSDFWQFDYNVSWCGFIGLIFGRIHWNTWIWMSLSQIWEMLAIISLNKLSGPFSYSSGPPIMFALFCLMLSHTLSFFLCSCDWMISKWLVFEFTSSFICMI